MVFKLNFPGQESCFYLFKRKQLLPAVHHNAQRVVIRPGCGFQVCVLAWILFCKSVVTFFFDHVFFIRSCKIVFGFFNCIICVGKNLFGFIRQKLQSEQRVDADTEQLCERLDVGNIR